MTDAAAIERYAQAIHAVREEWRQGENNRFFSYTWDERPDHMKELDRQFAAAVAALVLADTGAKLDELRRCITTFLSVNGSRGNAGDLAEGLWQILHRADQRKESA